MTLIPHQDREDPTRTRAQAFEALRGGDFAQAIALGLDAMPHFKKDMDLLGMIGIASSKLGDIAHAEKHLRKALKSDPSRNAWRHALAEALFQDNRLDEAMTEYERVIAHGESSPLPVLGKAAIYERRGDYEKAGDMARPYLEADHTGFAASVYATVLLHQKEWAQVITLLRPWLDRTDSDHRVRMSMSRTIAQAYEKTGDIPDAFEWHTESNRLCARPFDPEAYEAKIEDLIATYSAQNLAWLPKTSAPNDRHVFIASMPRSGSTLVEQILHAHPKAHAAGEINNLVELVRSLPRQLQSSQPYPDCLGDWNEARANQCQAAYDTKVSPLGRGAARVVNKHLDNWLHLGLVDLILPKSRVIHVTRDPMDNGFSIFMAGMHTGVYPWSTDLAHIGHVLRMHTRLMDHWKSVLGVEILEVPYEELVADSETWIRRIIDFAGLEWDDACLNFHEATRDVNTLSYAQVRQPIYKSAVKRWEKYAEFLGPLRDAIDRAE